MSSELSRSEKLKLTRLQRDLNGWYKSSARSFPWRSPQAGTYEKVVVEVLLQRTTAAAVSSFYDKFFSIYPAWTDLAHADVSDLEELLKPIGLWRRRANSLLGLARYATKVDGRFPEDVAMHASIPGVGQYVSNAVMMFQHGRAAPLLDANMARVIERVLRPRKLADIRYDPWLQAAARWLVRGRAPEETNWAVLDFAALTCRPRKPLCPMCPARAYCNFFARLSTEKAEASQVDASKNS